MSHVSRGNANAMSYLKDESTSAGLWMISNINFGLYSMFGVNVISRTRLHVILKTICNVPSCSTRREATTGANGIVLKLAGADILKPIKFPKIVFLLYS